jgi:hypothetical protein
MAKKIEELNFNYSIQFSRSMRLTNGKLNGYVGLQEIEIEFFDFSKKEDHLNLEKELIQRMEFLRKEMNLPIKYLKSESPFMYGGSDTWNVKIFFKCMPNLKGQKILTEIVKSFYLDAI